MRDLFNVFYLWLEWLDSHDGRIYRRSQGGTETDGDIVALIPNPPGRAIFTVGDLRALVAVGDWSWHAFLKEQEGSNAENKESR